MKFQKGDKIICINDINDEYVNYKLKLYQTYTVDSLTIGFDNGVVILINGTRCLVNINRFISLEDFRRMKLEKINSNLKINKYGSNRQNGNKMGIIGSSN